jgi:integrase
MAPWIPTMDTHLEGQRATIDPVPERSAGARKYQTEAAARAGGATWWRADTWPECLYKKLTVDRYFYRARSGSSRPFLQLETDDFGIAKRRLRDILKDVHDLRESGQTARSADFRTLGALAAEMMRIVERSGRNERTCRSYKNHLDRLRMHWQHGKFETFPAARVDLDLLMDLRDHLKNRCVFVAGRIGPNTRKLNRRKGYSNNIVNQTLWALRVCLDIAVEKRVRIENPFLTKSTLEKKINLPKGRRDPDLPSTETMQKLFAEMRSVADAKAVKAERGHAFSKIRQHYAYRAADLAEFLAYTGCRHEEALGVRVSDIDRNVRGFLFIDGTKSQQAKRDVPIAVPGLRELINRLKDRKMPNDTLFDPKADCLQPMARACKRLSIPKIVQHELRHYFATVMIEEGVSFALLAEWLGHADGGVLAAKTYGHIRKVHATSEARRVMHALARKSEVNPQAGNITQGAPKEEANGNLVHSAVK